MIRCSICSLPELQQAAIDEALRGAVPLGQIAQRCGASKSALSRHHAHIRKAQLVEVADTSALPAASVEIESPAFAKSAVPDQAELVRRLEFLWAEAVTGLHDARAPLTIEKRDGSKVQLPGDLRSAVGFIREGRAIVETVGQLVGVQSRGSQVNIAFITLPGGNTANGKMLDGMPIVVTGEVIEE